MNFISKPANYFYDGFSFDYEKPATCPYCGIGTDAQLRDSHYSYVEDGYLLTAVGTCTACNKAFMFGSFHKDDDSGVAKNVFIYPSVTYEKFQNESISKFSPRFIDVYNQSLQAEFNGAIDIAAIGFRTSLEILIKDFAINVLDDDSSKVSELKLMGSISEYLSEDLAKSADVIRILGNDYTHYQKKYPDMDFVILKKYMEIFVKQVEVDYMIKNPPVARKS
ncbi:DUF4145 domain-containing protein [Shuttleworthella satelles]|uniref:DUF4145 domain-containing protein n=1 Tax=Shuttleworthella satelles DSM 14600 TaxID=626523 RepID=C4GAU3_9FIRM|nr:DUF4145 domain-containing protein [Shuttleworthia satelles]EEP28236.1 hypothetical protein GCWU000342_01044 [Shuttleworthia satelles DSM 14600]